MRTAARTSSPTQVDSGKLATLPITVTVNSAEDRDIRAEKEDD